MSDWLDKLREDVCGVNEEPPKGFLCAKDIQKRYKFGHVGTANRLMNRMVASGKAKFVKVKRKTSGGSTVVKYIGPK